MQRRNRLPSRLDHRIRRLIGGSLAAVVLAQAGLADAAVSSVWSDRQQATPARLTLALPAPLSSALSPRLKTDNAHAFSSLISPALGTVRAAEPRAHGRKGSILLIQDVHLNLEAQKNISGAIETLAADRAFDLLAVEGSARSLQIAAFREAPDADSLRMAADFLLEKGQISGAVRAALIAKTSPRVEGIDDASLHATNAEAYRESGAALSGLQASISSEYSRLAKAKAASFGAELRSFDEKIADRRAEKISFAEYTAALSAEATRLSVPLPKSLRDFAEAATIEKSLDLARVEKERTIVLTRLSEKLSPADANDLLRAGIAFRSHDLSHADFYRKFSGFCQKAGLRTGEAPELQRYLRYLSLADGIDGSETLAASDAIEKAIFDRLARNEAQRKVIRDDRAAYLAGKLSRFALSRSEWSEWSHAPHNYADTTAFERFYTTAELRDAALAKNLLARMSDEQSTNAVAVVGGFHAGSLARRLGAAGYDVALFTPALTQVKGDGSDYLSVFSREKTPLEKLFDGQKLFLASDPMSDAAAVSLTDLVSARALLLRRPGDYATWFQRTLGLVLRDRRVQGGTVHHVFSDGNGRERAVDVDGVGAAGYSELPRAARPTGTYAVGKEIFGPFTDRWADLTRRFAPILELPQVYLSAFSNRFRDAFLTPSQYLARKRDALSVVHRGMALAAGIGAIAGLVGFILFGPASSVPDFVITGATWSLGVAAAASLFPALWLHDRANRNPETRLTEGDPGGYTERLRAYLAGLAGPPNALDTRSGAFLEIAQETEDLLRDVRSHELIRAAWLEAMSTRRAPFDEFLVAFFVRHANFEPNFFLPPILELNTSFARHPAHAPTADLIRFTADKLAEALREILFEKQRELAARTTDPIRVLEVTPEVRPFLPSGGMGVVNGMLPNELNKFHAWATTVSLYYDRGNYDLDRAGSPYSRKEKMPFTIAVKVDGEDHLGEVYKIRRRNDDGTHADFYFIKDMFKGTDNLTKDLYLAPSGVRLGLKQAVFLSEGALQVVKELHKAGGRRFDVLRGHDWQAVLAAIYMKTKDFSADPDMRDALKGVRPMVFFHNLEVNYRGEFNPKDWDLIGLGPEHKQAFGWTDVTSGPNFSVNLHGFNEKELNLEKAAAFHADGIFVPAPSYAKITQTEAYGYDMAPIFRARAHVVKGILNGMDYDPKDELIFPMGRRTVDDFLDHKARAKLLLLQETGLLEKIEAEVRTRLGANMDPAAFGREMAVEIDRPIFGAVLRLDPKMKGVWFMKTAGERLSHPDTPHPIRVVLLGSVIEGMPESVEFTRQMSALAAERPSNVAFFPLYAKDKGRRDLSTDGKKAAAKIWLGKKLDSLNDVIQAGAIGFYISKVEPGGLADVEAMRLGSVLATGDKGGPNDKTRDFDDPTITDREPTGVVFRGYYDDHEDMLRVIERLVNLYYSDRARYNRMMVDNKNTRLSMEIMAGQHVVAMADLIGRKDIVENPAKPVHQTKTPAASERVDLGLASSTATLLRLVHVHDAKATAAIGAVLESLFILAAIPACFFALGLPAGSALIAVQLAIFPAIHLFGAMTPVTNADGTISLRRDSPSIGRVLRLLVIGAILHAILPAGIGLAAHVLLNVLIVTFAKRAPLEEQLAVEVAVAARERLAGGESGASWQAAMRALVDGRAARVGVSQFGGTGATLGNLDGENFDAAAFRRALNNALGEEKIRASVPRAAAYGVAKEVALSGIDRESPEAAVARMSRTESNFIIAESLTDEALPLLVDKLRADPAIRATLIIKSGSDHSAAVAQALGSLSNVAMETSNDIISADGALTRVSMAKLDALIALRGFSGGRVHVWAGKNVEFDTDGLSRNSVLREALFTILDTMAVTASFQRMDLLDSMYRLMASQA